MTGDSAYLCCQLSSLCREQALEQEREKLLLHDCPDLYSLDLAEDEAPLTPEHRWGVVGTGRGKGPSTLGGAGAVPASTSQGRGLSTGSRF